MSQSFSDLSSHLISTGKKYDLEKIERAYRYAEKLHEGQFRQSGEPYISHPLAVALIVASLELDTDSICAALLHDTVEDCADRTDLQEVRALFGEDVALIVDGVTKIRHLQVEDKEDEHIENIRKMILAMSKDVRVIFIKLCDRLHNMRTLGAKKEDRQRTIALETMYVYAPLAHRLGMQKIKHELESLSLSFLDPIGYGEVSEAINRRFGENRTVIENAKAHIDERIREAGITSFTLEGRIKSVYSLYRKMYNQNKSFDEIYDFYALRVIVETELECYTVLGIIHEIFRSIPGRFKDYISTPKPNLYRSLHTTVIGRDGIPFEVQIRTYEMHHVAEYGIAAHWKYKSGVTSKEDIDQKLLWISRLLESEDVHDPDEFMHTFKTDIFHDETFVFTPKGDVISLPLGSTVIDFAYAIHSAVGNKMVGAKINGVIVPIDRVPQNGEIVEILTSSSSKGPSRDWLKIVRTGEARNKIRQWFKREKKSENIAVGKSEIDRELKRYGRAYTDAERATIVSNVAARLGIASSDDLYNTIGFGGLSISRISAKLHDEFERTVKAPPQEEPEQIKVTSQKKVKHSSGVILDGVDGCLVKFAKCCNPLPGDEIIGFITKGFGVSIHKCDCPNAVSGRKIPSQSDRWINAHWEASELKSDHAVYEALLRIAARDRLGVLADISRVLADMKVSILQINTAASQDEGVTLINLTVGCKNMEHCQSILSRIRSIPDIESVTRAFS